MRYQEPPLIHLAQMSRRFAHRHTFGTTDLNAAEPAQIGTDWQARERRPICHSVLSEDHSRTQVQRGTVRTRVPGQRQACACQWSELVVQFDTSTTVARSVMFFVVLRLAIVGVNFVRHVHQNVDFKIALQQPCRAARSAKPRCSYRHPQSRTLR